MEAILSSTQIDTDVLPPSLKFGLDPSGSWCLGKRNATVYSLGSSYSPNGVKKLDFSIGSTTEWLVPETCTFSAMFENEGTEVEGCWPATPDANCLFERIDVRMGGQLIESITESARCNQLFTLLTMSPQKRLNNAQIGFGTQVPTDVVDWASSANHDAGIIAKNAKKRIYVPLGRL